MGLRSGSVRLALYAILIGTVSAWALAPHDKAVGVHAAQLGDNQADKRSASQPQSNPTQSESSAPGTRDDAKAARERKQDRRDKLRGDTIAGIVGLITLFVLSIQTYFFRRQARSLENTITTMRRLGRRQSKDMQASIDVAQAAAQAAIDQVALSRTALTSTERAFIVPDPFISYPIVGDDEKTIIGWQFRVVWRNVGNTPTSHLRSNSGLLIRKVDDLPRLEYSRSHATAINKSYIGPDKTSALQKHEVVIEVVVDARADEVDLYLWAWADYNDVFEGTPRHRTEICVKIIVVGDPDTKECGFGYQLIGEFNGLDGECQHRPLPYQN